MQASFVFMGKRAFSLTIFYAQKIKKVIADTGLHDTIKKAKEEQVTDMTEIFNLGKVNTKVLEKKFGKIWTGMHSAS